MSNYTNNMFNKEDPNNCWTIIYGLVPNKSKVLDVGCSSGNFGKVLIEEKDCYVYGLDIDEKDIIEANKKLNGASVLDIENDDISNLEKFDVIIFADVLEHLKSPSKVLEKIKPKLKKQGKVVFSIPNMSHISTRLALMEGTFNYTPTGILDETHLRFYDYKEVESIFNKAKYSIETMKTTTLPFKADLVEEKLSNIGLKPTEVFYKHLENTHANVFQFVGIAAPTQKEKSNSLKYTYPIDVIKEHQDKQAELTRNHIQNLEANIKELTDALESTRAEIEQSKKPRYKKLKDKLINRESK